MSTPDGAAGATDTASAADAASSDEPVPDGAAEIYRNEFAMVEVARYQTGTGPRLRIRDLASGAQVFLDPVELESLTRWKHGDFAPLVDPGGLVAVAEPDPDEV